MQQPRIQVIVRKRPLTSREAKQSQADVIDVVGPDALVVREEK